MTTLAPLPYGYEALEPTMSAETLHFHYDKHHKAYVDKANEITAAKGITDKTVEELVAYAEENGEKVLYNQAGQIWNHSFYWNSMTPSYAAPTGELAAAIEAFGGLDALKDKFVAEGIGQFGSGWVWLAADSSGVLSVVKSHDAETLALGKQGTPLLVADVWEHAYYIDKRNDRKGFLTAWFEKLANWEFAAAQFAAAKSGAGAWAYPETAAA